MSQKELKLPIVFAEIAWNSNMAERYGKINTQNLVIKTMSLVTDIIKEHGGKIIEITGKQVFCTYPNTRKAIQAVIQKQRTINSDTLLFHIDVTMKIGLHYGVVQLNKDDVKGETVSIARKLMEIAKEGQILLTRDTLQEVPVALNIPMTKRGKLKTRESLFKLEVLEAHWQEESGEHTVFVEEGPKSGSEARMVLEYRQKNYVLSTKKDSFLIGRSNENDIIIDDSAISRKHAAIKLVKGRFRLIDQSTNGTYYQQQGDQEEFLHKDSIQLAGDGFISLGRKIGENNPGLVKFSIID